MVHIKLKLLFHNIQNKNAFQLYAYCLLVDHIPACTRQGVSTWGGVSAQGVSTQEGVCPGGVCLGVCVADTPLEQNDRQV